MAQYCRGKHLVFRRWTNEKRVFLAWRRSSDRTASNAGATANYFRWCLEELCNREGAGQRPAVQDS